MSGGNDLAMLGRVVGGLIVVLVVIGLVAKVARRAHAKDDGNGLRVVERLGLSREANLAVIEVSNRTLLLGVTAQGVTMLANLDDVSAGPLSAQPTHLDLTDFERQPVEVDVDVTQFDLAAEPDDDPRAGYANIVGEDQPNLHGERTAVPNGVALDQYPDLASALRAAGRTTDSVPSQPAPRTRAEARAQRAAAAARAETRPEDQTRVQAAVSAPAPAPARLSPAPNRPTQPIQPSARKWPRLPGQTKTSGLKVTHLDDAGNPLRTQQTPAKPTRIQASGSVLSPRTWRQGVDALRDLTVRRG